MVGRKVGFYGMAQVQGGLFQDGRAQGGLLWELWQRELRDRLRAVDEERCAFTGKLAKKGGLIFLDVTHLCW